MDKRSVRRKQNASRICRAKVQYSRLEDAALVARDYRLNGNEKDWSVTPYQCQDHFHIGHYNKDGHRARRIEFRYDRGLPISYHDAVWAGLPIDHAY